jgi:CheY-like chemotaxis protein
MPESQKRVLVVDDDADIRLLLKTMLLQRGLVVDAADSGKSALELIQQNNYAVVLLDLMMPGMDGFGVLEKLNDPAMPSPVVLVITGADRASIDRARGAQLVHGIVRKPFDPDELGNLVVACADIRTRGALGAMALAVIAGSPLLALLSNRWG